MSADNMEMSSSNLYVSMVELDSPSKRKSKSKAPYVPKASNVSEPYINTEKLEQLEDLYDISKSSDKTLLIVTRTNRLRLKRCKQ
jgi:hypothetical protein